MRRSWFKDSDGTYYRNSNCVELDIRWAERRPWMWWRVRGLWREWNHVFWQGVTRTDKIGRRDVVLVPRPFREAYPNHPGLWRLDDLP